MRRAGLALALCLGALAAPAAHAGAGGPARLLEFGDLDGWAEADHGAAFDVFMQTCPDLRDPDWANICGLATSDPEPRRFFELFFRPVQIGIPGEVVFTGYYEPELAARAERDDDFRYPIYEPPSELSDDENRPWLTRAEIETDDTLAERGLAIAWLRDPVERYFLQVQGSGRLRFPDGRMIRVGYADRNGHARQPISAELMRRGIYTRHQVSSTVIRNWVRRNPEAGRTLLHSDPSYVFFRVIDDLADEHGPRGAMNQSLSPMRSVAVDPDFVPLGAPVWVEAATPAQMRRLMVAQDTGGDIKGPQRADIFFGSGPDAGRRAGRMRAGGRLVVLMPIRTALSVAPQG